MEFPSQHHQQQAKNDHAARPNVGGEVKGIGFQSLTVILGGNPAQSTRAPEVHRHGKEHHGEGGDARFNFHMEEEQTLHGFIHNPNASQQQQAGFDES